MYTIYIAYEKNKNFILFSNTVYEITRVDVIFINATQYFSK